MLFMRGKPSTSNSESMMNNLKGVGSNVRFTMYPEGNHIAWNETYGNEKLYEWLMKQRRSQ
jgi:predicted peptidase